MCDDENCPSFKEIMECLTDFLFRETIKCTGRLVEEDDVWILEEYLRDGESLFLTPGEFYSPLSYLGFESVFELVDKFTLR